MAQAGLAPSAIFCFPSSAMIKLCIFAGTTVCSYIGWYAGDALGLGFGWSFALSGIGSIAGVILGWKLGRRIER